MSNSSSITQFFLLPFTDTRELQLLPFWLFLDIYLAALLSNGLIITTIAWDQHLHTPMYFFLPNLSLLDLGFISTTLPKSMANSLWNTRAISYTGCAAQVFLVVFLASAEYWLLTITAYDRYVAICKPLHYRTLLGSRACVHMAAAAWASGFLNALLHTANTFSLPLCQAHSTVLAYLGYKNIEGRHAKSLAEAEVNDIHCSPLMQKRTYFIMKAIKFIALNLPAAVLNFR
ncbi:olfactory receptor 14I1-like [Columba livia]|uniref:olfactory receptor 14I1-like n=1 Tax=Columba livia TaxID=8932 RepID=UPI0031BA6288